MKRADLEGEEKGNIFVDWEGEIDNELNRINTAYWLFLKIYLKVMVGGLSVWLPLGKKC